MKKLIYLLLAIATVACTSSKESGCVKMDGEGTIEIAATRSDEVGDTTTEGRTKIATPAVEELAVVISGNGETFEWSTLAEFKKEAGRGLTFKTAPYTVTLSHGEKVEGVMVEGYGKPYFEGSTTVEVPGYGLSATAEVVVALANSILAITTTPNFDGYFQQAPPKFTVRKIEWNAESAEMLFLNPGVATIECVVVKPSGKTLTVDVELKAQTRHTAVFDLPNAGSTEVTVKFDNEILETKVEEFEMNDEA